MTSATARRSSSSAACAARVVELVQDVGVDPARAPLAVVRLGGALALDGHVVRMDLGGDPIEQDPSFAPDGGGPDPSRQKPRGQRLDDRATDLVADLLASVGDRQGDLQDRLGPARGSTPSRWRRSGPNSVGNIARQPSGSVVSPFMTARARTRWAGVASASSRPPGRRSGRPGSPRRRSPGRRGRRPGTSWPLPERRRGRPGGTSRASRWRDAGR